MLQNGLLLHKLVANSQKKLLNLQTDCLLARTCCADEQSQIKKYKCGVNMGHFLCRQASVAGVAARRITASEAMKVARSTSAQSGFTLIELMITVAIVAILAAAAYPSYIQYVVRSNRSAAQSFILGVANQQEQYNMDARQYATTMAALGYTTIPSEVAKNYTVTVDASNAAVPPSYLVTATPIGGQATNDTVCQKLTIDQAGTKGISGTGAISNCW